MANLTKLLKDIATLYLNPKFSDICFVINSEQIPAHKAILAVRSKYFETELSTCTESVITLKDVSLKAFKIILNYLYTGFSPKVSTNLDFTMKVLYLANKFCVEDLEVLITKQITKLINVDSVGEIIQKAKSNHISKLCDSCLTFIDEHAFEFLKSKKFKTYSQELLIMVLQRHTFKVPEIEIFKSVAEWHQNNGKTNNDLLECVRLSYLTVAEIYSVVEPTKLVDNDVLIKTIGEISGFRQRTLLPRIEVTDTTTTSTQEINIDTVTCSQNKVERDASMTKPKHDNNSLLNTNVAIETHGSKKIKDNKNKNVTISKISTVDIVTPKEEMIETNLEASLSTTRKSSSVNIASPACNAKVLSKSTTDLSFLLTDNKHSDKFASFPLWDPLTPECFKVKLGVATYVNNINISFHSGKRKRSSYCQRFYRYYIEVSDNGNTWKKIIDYTRYNCRLQQELYFEIELVQYLKVVGTFSSEGPTLDISCFEVYYKNPIPKLMNGVIYPSTNVALLSKGAIVIEGYGDNAILDGDSLSDMYSSHLINSNSIIIQLAQPYMINRIKLRLYDLNPEFYKYYIETSDDKFDWTKAVDKTDAEYTSWQELSFAPRPTVYIKIVGTYSSSKSSDNDGFSSFRCHHVECWAE